MHKLKSQKQNHLESISFVPYLLNYIKKKQKNRKMKMKMKMKIKNENEK
jgi:hypothetical protein